MNTDKDKREYSKKEEIDEFDEYETDEQEEFDDSDGQGFFAKIIIVLLILVLITSVVLYDTFWGKGFLPAAVEQIKVGLLDSKESSEEPSQKNVDIVSTSEISEDNNGQEESVITDQDTISSMKFEANSRSSFRTFGQEFLQCTKDGVKYFEEMDSQKWNSTFTMTSPVITGEGEYTAVCELGGRVIKVYNRDGEIYSIQTEGIIERFSLNANGYLSVITDLSPDHRVQVFDNKGAELMKREEKQGNIYPLDVDISDDNRIVAVSYLDTSDVMLKGKILFFYAYRSEGKDFTDAMFAAVEKEDELIPSIHFMEGGVLSVLTDQSIYSFGSDGAERWKYDLTNEVTNINCDNKKYIVFSYGQELSNKEGIEPGTVVRLDLQGKEKMLFHAGEDVTMLTTGDSEIVVGCGRDFYGVTNGGKVIWSYSAGQDVVNMLFMQNPNTVLCVTNVSANILEMKENESTKIKSRDKKDKKRTRISSDTSSASAATSSSSSQDMSESSSTEK
ncbi:MAG: hypothetical protein KHZ62_07365 [Clostridiales bacterium]|nr:hypothetical protein [Clostridiales bacterium]